MEPSSSAAGARRTSRPGNERPCEQASRIRDLGIGSARFRGRLRFRSEARSAAPSRELSCHARRDSAGRVSPAGRSPTMHRARSDSRRTATKMRPISGRPKTVNRLKNIRPTTSGTTVERPGHAPIVAPVVPRSARHPGGAGRASAAIGFRAIASERPRSLSSDRSRGVSFHIVARGFSACQPSIEVRLYRSRRADRPASRQRSILAVHDPYRKRGDDSTLFLRILYGARSDRCIDSSRSRSV